MKQPLIGVTCYLEKTLACEKKFNTSPLYISYPEYDARLAESGAIPVNLPSLSGDAGLARDYAKKLDGLLICGGEDINPVFYQEKSEGNFRYVTTRDQFEFALLEAFLKQEKPILGICRGLQVINVYFGGTLIQDIASAPGPHLIHTRSDVPSQGVHQVTLSGPWAERLGHTFCVNSMHHQAVKTLGRGLRTVGLSEDGLIEAIEGTDYPFLFAVQWHPEMLIPVQTPIFQLFSQSAAEKSAML